MLAIRKSLANSWIANGAIGYYFIKILFRMEVIESDIIRI